MKTNFETAGKTAKEEIIREISNTLWKYTNSTYSNGVEITENLNGVEIVATIDTWPNGAMSEINGKKYRTRKGSTLKRDIVDTVTEWVDELTKVEEQPTTEKEVFVEWYEGYYGEWIFGYNAFLKLLLMGYSDGDYTNIRERLGTSAEKVVRNIEYDEISDAVVTLAEKDAEYGMVNIDWTNKDLVDKFINDKIFINN